MRVDLISRCLSSFLSDCLEVSRLIFSTSELNFFEASVEDSGQFSLARNTLKNGEPGLLTIVREHETVPNGFGRLGTTV